MSESVFDCLKAAAARGVPTSISVDRFNELGWLESLDSLNLDGGEFGEWKHFCSDLGQFFGVSVTECHGGSVMLEVVCLAIKPDEPSMGSESFKDFYGRFCSPNAPKCPISLANPGGSWSFEEQEFSWRWDGMVLFAEVYPLAEVYPHDEWEDVPHDSELWVPTVGDMVRIVKHIHGSPPIGEVKRVCYASSRNVIYLEGSHWQFSTSWLVPVRAWTPQQLEIPSGDRVCVPDIADGLDAGHIRSWLAANSEKVRFLHVHDHEYIADAFDVDSDGQLIVSLKDADPRIPGLVDKPEAFIPGECCYPISHIELNNGHLYVEVERPRELASQVVGGAFGLVESLRDSTNPPVNVLVGSYGYGRVRYSDVNDDETIYIEIDDVPRKKVFDWWHGLGMLLCWVLALFLMEWFR